MPQHDDDLPSLEKLQQRIDELKGPDEGSTDSTPKGNIFSQAMRFSIDLFAGVVVGVGFGYLMDQWLETIPLFMIAGLFIGMAAGVRNMMRSANKIEPTDSKPLYDDENKDE